MQSDSEQSRQNYRFYCQVTFPGGSLRRIGSENIKSGTAYVKSKCVSGSDFELGAVCIGEFGVSLLDDNIDSGNYQGAVIRPFCCVRLSDGTFKRFPWEFSMLPK